MVLVQIWPFFQLFFLGNIGQENVFYDILKRKNAFLGYKKADVGMSKNGQFFKGVNPCFWSKNGHFSNFLFLGNIKTRSLKSRKIVIFPKGLTHGFGAKIAILPTFFLGNIGQENVFYDILERKNAFLRYKNKKFKKTKNWHSSKGVNPWFWSKNGHFSNFFF